MTILVAAASRRESTLGIAEAVAAELRTMGYQVDVARIGPSLQIDRYDAAVLGSAVYLGKWLPEAASFIRQNRRALNEMPVWLFSSGPLGWENPVPTDETVDVAAHLAESGARGHRVFEGKLDRGSLGFMERLATRAVKAPEGDFRDWNAIRDWARGIGDCLGGRPPYAALPVAEERRA